MKKSDLLSIFKINDILDLPKSIMELLDANLETRNAVYIALLELNNFDVSYDWFQNIYEEDFAQRKQSKQDFTPNSVAKLASLLTGNRPGWIYEPTAGNGSMLIADWWQRCNKHLFPSLHLPSENMITCWELSDRSIPLLLLNLSIRGIMGYVYHGDVLTKEIKSKYILLNRTDNTLGFSEIYKDPENKIWIKNGDKLLKHEI